MLPGPLRRGYRRSPVGVPPVAGPTFDSVFGTPSADTVLSPDKLTVSRVNTSGGYGFVRSTKAIPAGGAFCEMTFNAIPGPYPGGGVVDDTITTPAYGGNAIGDTGHSGQILKGSGWNYNGAGAVGYGRTAPVAGDTLILLYIPNIQRFHVWFPGDGGGWDFGGALDAAGSGRNPTTFSATTYFAAGVIGNGDSITMNFGATTFVHSTECAALVAVGYPSLKDA
jgi:hypothetical protein